MSEGSNRLIGHSSNAAKARTLANENRRVFALDNRVEESRFFRPFSRCGLCPAFMIGLVLKPSYDKEFTC